MTWQIVENRIGLPSINVVSAGRRLAPLGTTVRAFNQTFGEGEFIYLAVPAATAIPAGTLCVINPTDVTAGQFTDGDGIPTPALVSQPFAGTVTTDASQGRTGVVALNAVASVTGVTQFTWFQLSGQALVLKAAVQVLAATATVGRLNLSGTAGRVTNVVTSGSRQILGMRAANTAIVTTTVSTVLVNFQRPIIGQTHA